MYDSFIVFSTSGLVQTNNQVEDISYPRRCRPTYHASVCASIGIAWACRQWLTLSAVRRFAVAVTGLMLVCWHPPLAPPPLAAWVSSTTVSTFHRVDAAWMDENSVRLTTWCIAASQFFNAAGRISSEDSNALLKHIHVKVLRSLHGPHGVVLVNEQTSLVTLPDRILRQILLLVNLRDRITLEATCKHLRDRCDVLAVLQPIIHIRPAGCWLTEHRPSKSSLERAVSIARQSLPAGLESVTLTWWPELSSELSSFLTGNLARIRVLKIRFPCTIAKSPHCARELFAALATPAPLLTELQLGVSFGIGPLAGPFWIDAFGDPHAVQHLTSLRKLFISAVHLPLHSGLVFVGVRELRWLYGAPHTLTRDTLASLIACFPRLETLRIRAGRVSWPSTSLPVRSLLRHVHVDTCGEIDDLAGFLESTRIQLLTLTHPAYKSAAALVDSLTRASESISVGPSFCEFVVKPRSLAGLAGTPTIRYLTPALRVRVQSRHFVASLRHMTCLSLSELFWPQPQTFASGPGTSYVSGLAIHLPALTRLRVSLATCRSRRQVDDNFLSGILLGLDDPLSPLQTPALRNLEISYFLRPGYECVDPSKTQFAGTGVSLRRGRTCCCCRTLTVSLCDIHHFVSACVRTLNGRRLEHIRVHGVEVVDPDPFPYLALIERLATVVSVSPVPRPNSCDLGATLYSDYDDYTRLDFLDDVS